MHISIKNLSSVCRLLAKEDSHLARVYKTYGTPPLWDLEQSFATLVYIILGQQVSLASAKACFDKLNKWLGNVTPESFLTLNDGELKKIGFSRQKTSYGRNVAEALIEGNLSLEKLNKLTDQDVKIELERIKGIGTWTSDIYLLMAMLRPDIMPKGDLALHVAWKELAGLEERPKSDEFIEMAKHWEPYRSVAARLLWHYYLCKRGKGDFAHETQRRRN